MIINPWVDGAEVPKKPRWFDLCLMQLEDGKEIRAWWDGEQWIGPRYKGQAIKRWRHVHYDE